MAAASDDPPPPSAFADDVAPTTTSSPPGERAGGRWSSSTSSVAFDPDMSGREGVGVGGRRRWMWGWILIMLHSRGAAGSPHLRNKSHDAPKKRNKNGSALFCCCCLHACSVPRVKMQAKIRIAHTNNKANPTTSYVHTLLYHTTQHIIFHLHGSIRSCGVYGTATSMIDDNPRPPFED